MVDNVFKHLDEEKEKSKQAEKEREEARVARDEAEEAVKAKKKEVEELAKEVQKLKLYSLQQQQQQQSHQGDQQDQQQSQDVQQSLDSAELSDIAPWIVSRNDVHTAKELGRGRWGIVMQGTLQGEAVAVKVPHKDLLNQRLLNQLKREAGLIIQVQHPNLVRIIAAVCDEDANQLKRPPMLITELLDVNLRQCYLEKRLHPTSRIPVFLDVAYGLHYLHDRQEPIIHRDVSAPNVLLKALPNGMWRAKVSAFRSPYLVRLPVTTGNSGTAYNPPEVFPKADPSTPPTPHTTKIDVYSFGILMCEVVTAEQPDPEVYRERLEQIKRLSQTMNILIGSCTDQSPDKRPTMASVINDLSNMSPF